MSEEKRSLENESMEDLYDRMDERVSDVALETMRRRLERIRSERKGKETRDGE